MTSLDKITTEKFKEGYLAIRCPECLKEYLVKEDLIQSTYPEFTCQQCQGHFSFEYPVVDRQAIITFKTQPLDITNKRSCPKCQFLQSEKNEICSSCGVVIENYLLIRAETYPKVSIDLIKKWNQVLKHFDLEFVHEDFITCCRDKNQLVYAEFKYKELGQGAGDTTLTLPWLKKIRPDLYSPKTDSVNVTSEKETKHGRHLIFQFIKKGIWIPWVIIGLGSFFIFMGIVSHSQKNKIGVGIALLGLGFGIHTMFFEKKK